MISLFTGCGDSSGASSNSAGLPIGKQELPSASIRDSMVVNGVTRSWLLVPPTPANSAPVELVFYFHGYGGSGYEAGQWDPGVPGRVSVYPNGLVQSWYQNAIGWDNRSNSSVDVKFIAQLLDTLLARYSIDPTRVYSTGFSWGGWMSNTVGCALGDRLAGMVSAAGGGPGGAASSCVSTLPVEILHATNDGAENQSEGIKSRDFWRTKNGCKTDSMPIGTHGCVTYKGCTKPVIWCSHDGGHSAPSWWLEQAWSGFGN
jgi:polyhydroxybutyrate depolymerase